MQGSSTGSWSGVWRRLRGECQERPRSHSGRPIWAARAKKIGREGCERSEAIQLSTRRSLDAFTAPAVQSAVSTAEASAEETRPNGRTSGGGTVDCFAPLAMTVEAAYWASP